MWSMPQLLVAVLLCDCRIELPKIPNTQLAFKLTLAAPLSSDEFPFYSTLAFEVEFLAPKYNSALSVAANSHSDLIPNVYEGPLPLSLSFT